MKNLFVMAVATMFATNAFAAEMKWNGSAGWRYSQSSTDDGLSSLDNNTPAQGVSKDKARSHELRANLGATGGWEHVEYGFGLRTQNKTAAAANNDYTPVGNNLDPGIGLDQAWMRYVRDFGSLDLGVTVGRQKNALIYDQQWETLFSNNVRWDGFGWNFKFGMFGLNAAQYILGSAQHSAPAGGTLTTAAQNTSTYKYTDSSQNVASTKNNFQVLYAFQPHMNWKFSDEIEAMFAVSYYRWVYEGSTNAIGGAGVTQFNANSTGTVPVLPYGTYRMDGNSQWDFLLNLSLPMNFAFTGDFVKANKASYNNMTVATTVGNNSVAYNGSAVDVGSSAWTLGLTYGKLRKAQDFTIGYAYGTKGIGSVIDGYTNDKFAADTKGHTVVVGYSMADNFNLGFRWMSLKEKEKISTSGTATTGGNAGSAYGPDATGAAGKNANQGLSTSYWELTAGVAF